MKDDNGVPWSGTGSPGDGVTPALLSREPLATEGEATPGPDDVNPFDEMETRKQLQAFEDGSRSAVPEFSPIVDPLTAQAESDELELPPLW